MFITSYGQYFSIIDLIWTIKETMLFSYVRARGITREYQFNEIIFELYVHM